MLEIMREHWWIFLLRGVVAVLFGVVAILAPTLTLATGLFSLVVLFGAYVLVDGLALIYTSLHKRSEHENWLVMALWGVVSVVAGVVLLGNPIFWAAAGAFTIVVLVNVVAIWNIVSGGMQVVNAIRLRREIDNEFQLLVGGVLSVLFGIILLRLPPGADLRVFVLVLALNALMTGGTNIALAQRLRSMPEETATG